MCTSAERSYPGGKSVPASARSFGHSMVMATLLPAGWALADDVAIVISELATAAVVAGVASIRVRVSVHYDHIAILITHDESASVGAAREQEDAVATRHAVLNALASRVVTTADLEGRTHTKARLRCDPRYTERVACRYRPTR